MDKEILFRGKRRDNNKWVYGYLICCAGHRFIVDKSNPTSLRSLTTHHCDRFDWRSVKVNPPTVGQYTGLTDKNGVKIFEGDIVKQINLYDNLKIQGPVVYGKAAQYIVRHTYTEQEDPYKKGKTKAFAVSPRCEVIGNVHDNPKLIGGEGNG